MSWYSDKEKFDEQDPPYCKDCDGGESYEECKACQKAHYEMEEFSDVDYEEPVPFDYKKVGWIDAFEYEPNHDDKVLVLWFDSFNTKDIKHPRLFYGLSHFELEEKRWNLKFVPDGYDKDGIIIPYWAELPDLPKER